MPNSDENNKDSGGLVPAQNARLKFLNADVDRVDHSIRQAREDLLSQQRRLRTMSARLEEMVEKICDAEARAVQAAKEGLYAIAHQEAETAERLRKDVDETLSDRDHLQAMIEQLADQLNQLQEGCDRIRDALVIFEKTGIAGPDFPTIGNA